MTPPIQNDLVSVFGQASIVGVPDSVVVTLAVERTAESGVQAITALNAATLRVVQALTERGVPQSDLDASQPAVCPIYLHSSQVMPVKPWETSAGMNGGAGAQPSMGGRVEASRYPTGATLEATRTSTPQPTTYAAIGLLSVSIRDISRINELVQTAFAAGANTAVGQRPVFQDESLLRYRALEAACGDARRKAEHLATSTGRQLGQALYFNELEDKQLPRPLEQREAGLPGTSTPLQFPVPTEGAGAGAGCGSQFASRVQAAFRLI